MTGPRTIDGYLDQLLVELYGRARDVRRILAEVEDHLRDATDEAIAAGMDPSQAEAAAIERFGSPRVVARRFGATLPVPGPAVLGELVRSLAGLAAIGLLAIGLSGVAAMGMRATLGASFVAGDLPGVTYTRERCADFFEYHPEAGSCAAAATAHHADEVESYRLAAGVLGTLLGVAWLWDRRRRRTRGKPDRIGALPEGFAATCGLALFGAAGALLALQSIGLMLGTGASHGAGQWLSGAVVSLAMAVACGGLVLRTIRTRAALPG